MIWLYALIGVLLIPVRLLAWVTRPVWGTLPGLQVAAALVCFALGAWLRTR